MSDQRGVVMDAVNKSIRAENTPTVKVRITGNFQRTMTEDFTVYFDLPAPPPDDEEHQDEFDTWCSLVNTKVEKLKDKSWFLADWNYEVEA